MKFIRGCLFGLAIASLSALPGCGGHESVEGFFPATHGKWTVLVYMNAANDLDLYSFINVNQMEQVATNSQVRFVVQWKQSTSVSNTATFNGTRRYLVKPDQTSAIKSQLIQNMGLGVDMGVPQTLNDFIKWGQAHYPADHYALVLWDHGNGWLPEFKGAKKTGAPPAFSYDGETGHAIQIWQLNQAFQGLHVDITAFDASLMQMDEVAYQLIGYTDYVAGSEESPPGPGYPYQRVLAEFTNNPDESPRILSKAFVDGMLEEPTYENQKIEQSVVDTSQMAGVATAALNLQQAMVANQSALDPIIPGLRTTTQSYLPTTNRFYFDSIGLFTQLSAQTGVPAVQTACNNYVTAANVAIVWEGHNSFSPGSHGLSVDFSPSSYFATVAGEYDQLAWNSATQWFNWLIIAP